MSFHIKTMPLLLATSIKLDYVFPVVSTLPVLTPPIYLTRLVEAMHFAAMSERIMDFRL